MGHKMGLKFELGIALGNSAMSTNYDIAKALREVADRLEERQKFVDTSEEEGSHFPDLELADTTQEEYGYISDLNGNTVGSWNVVKRKKV